jgi:hypothetical protein
MSTPTPETPQVLQLQLSLVDVNTILEALGQLPFVRVHELIQKIHVQAQQQLNAAPPGNSR